MTSGGQPGSDWDDARLAAAFAARAETAPPTPPDLFEDVVERVSAASRRVRRWPVLAAAAAVALAVGLGNYAILGGVQNGPHRSTAVPGGSGAANPPARGGLTDPVLDALGEPITVSAAIAIRDSDQPHREVVVTGFLSPMPPIPCPNSLEPVNPTFLRCPQTLQWLMEQPEQLVAVGPSSLDGGPPKGPAIHPSFALVDAPVVPMPGEGALTPVPVVLIGHFHDRRAAWCQQDREECGRTFVVDRVASVNGAQRLPTTQRLAEGAATDLEADVDSLVLGLAPGASIESRQLTSIDQVAQIEPGLEHDEVISAWGNRASLMWVVTAIDLDGGIPVARTFALIDGTNWFAEVTANGATMHVRAAPGPSGEAQPVVPSGDPAAFDAAPSSVVGLPVQGVAAVTERRRLDGATDRSEYAIRAWYVGPRPDITCSPPEPAIHPPVPPCDEARHWLLDDPQQYGVEQGQLRRDPDQWPPVLNPIVPIDLPFDVGDTWSGDLPVSLPVVVLGHFSGEVNAFHGNVYFVIDRLAWTRDRAVQSLDTLTRLTSAPAREEPSAVLSRIGATTSSEAVATWVTVVDASDFASLEPGVAADAPEFTEGTPVWIVRRLIRNEMDGRQRLAIERVYTADGGDRVWMTETPDSPVDLATTIVVGPFGEHTREVKVYDYGNWIVSVRRATAADDLAWRPANPKRDGIVDVARGATDRQVGIRWSGGACNPDWRLLVRADPRRADSEIYIEAYTFGDFCSNPGDVVTRSLMITFDRPIDLERVRSSDGSCCG